MCDSLGWGMVKVMHIVLLKATKAVFVATTFIVFNVDEVMMINNSQKITISI
jgi:predicted SPOUT superfamily RNA methylase MTH1